MNAVDHEMIGFTPVIAKDVIGDVDNSAYPAINVHIHMMVVTPADAKGPVPVLMMFGRAGFPASQRAVGRGSRQDQRGMEGAAGPAGSVAEGSVRDSIRRGSRSRPRRSSSRS